MTGRSDGRRVAVEVAVQDVAGARVAARAGADRVELCAALGATGGVTPGPGLVARVLEALADLDGSDALGVHVLVRPRPGGFVHDADEADVLVAEVRSAVAAGAAGVVVGALTGAGVVDAALVARLVDAADGREVTFHRALDVVAEPLRAVDRLADLGVVRVLTSGGRPRAADATVELRTLVAHAAGRLQVMAGGGVVPGDVARLVRAGVDAVHLSARASVPDRGPAGPGGGAGGDLDVTDAALVGQAVAAAATG
ncbi:copper homeostasis protein CutC [Cellulomonas carbonis]|uniref:copper homeostasis protein CutC n=1 Tax=Cellulomonas carbonis TaxID=1386092 RepID=UPI0005B8B642|nr:copper homeostasis protein CutC [Cellulomonas carbonis]GGC16190.1 hypothetical protein GCM10010972_31860 [Cellulomonas carbonis]